MLTVKVFLLGIADGWREPFDLTSGMTWPNFSRNEWYDRGVNVGQSAGLFAHNLITLGKHDAGR